MAKELRPPRPSGKSAEDTLGSKAPADSEPTRTGSDAAGFRTDQYGRTCWGNSCVEIAVDEARNEIVVNVRPNAPCAEEIQPLVDAIRRTLGKGARTVYEVESELKEPK